MKFKTKIVCLLSIIIMNAQFVAQSQAAIALDRTRIIFDGSRNSISLNISNENKNLPYLAQGWLEDEGGNKIQSPLIVLPPVQRIEPGKSSQVKIQALPAAKNLPQDRETVFYFNLREIPPRSDKPNTLQIALQTRIKLFFRPEAIMQTRAEMATPWQDKLTLSRQAEKYVVENPTPYYITIVDVSKKEGALGVSGFQPFMIAPKGKMMLGVTVASVGNTPVLTYINDYGGRPQLIFNCAEATCKLVSQGYKP